MNKNKVVWTEGLFLQPHHFQQQERYYEQYVNNRCAALGNWGWGYLKLEIDAASLKLGKLALLTAEGVFKDGTPFVAPDIDAIPTPLDIPSDVSDELVVLALPLPVDGQNEQQVVPSSRPTLARHQALDIEVADITGTAALPASMLVGRINARLMLERDVTGAYTTIGVAKIRERRADGVVVLDTDYIPPALSCRAVPMLDGYAREIVGLLRQRGRALAARIANPGRGSVAEIAEYLLLGTINRYEPVFSHLADAPGLHPEALYRHGLQLAGDLATFSHEDRLPLQFGKYDHDDLATHYHLLMDDLRRSLSMVFDQSAVAIELQDRKYGVRVAIVPDMELLRQSGFVLAASAQIPAEALRLRLPAQMKVGPIEKIRDLVNLQLPGIALRSLPVAPRQVPYHAGFHYFELDRNHELWGQLERSGGLALHVAGDFPGLQLELWAIKS
ncbi:type VI secretion system baseplate subunit TssK [Parachitinimonas caeni]|uniref:Type VI secretion system baseplate subunit TssK n=1 Tax=Parachitinimonas caeni TaxID=3031301 RepID=A0ABT7E2M9_9NEIS|nr:type VI secretion system baseplate subunit TssK [Parachitinimonas caeni]MDK2126553.1 type VI secretion system baseplate subunit TssK [Parachitinimonas caeni]